MVDFLKRARNSGDLDPDEEVIGASNVMPSPFLVPNAGMTGGVIAGGVVGAAVGAAWDARRSRKGEEEQATKVLPGVAARPAFEPEIPTNGALLAVTTKRVVAWTISAMGKPKAVLLTVPHAEIDEVWWVDAETKWLAGKPASLLIWIGTGQRVLSLAGIVMGPSGKFIRSVVAGLDERLPGRVLEFEEPSAS